MSDNDTSAHIGTIGFPPVPVSARTMPCWPLYLAMCFGAFHEKITDAAGWWLGLVVWIVGGIATCVLLRWRTEEWLKRGGHR